MKSVEDKFLTVIQKNTFYFFNQKFEEGYEGYINSLKETLLIVKNKVETEGLKKEIKPKKWYHIGAVLGYIYFSFQVFQSAAVCSTL